MIEMPPVMNMPVMPKAVTLANQKHHAAQLQAKDSVSIQFGAKDKVTQAVVNQDVAEASKVFAQNMMATLVDSATSKSTVISPANTFLLVNLLQMGATAKTGKEIQDALGMGGLIKKGATKDQVAEGVKAYMADFSQLMDDTGITLKQAYGIWAKPGNKWQKSFEKRVSTLGGHSATLTNADDVNKWAAEKTNNKIKSILKDEEVRNADSVLASATYLLSNWRKQFDPTKTTNWTFNGQNGQTTVKMMATKSRFQFNSGNPLFNAVSLPYGKAADSGRELRMTFFLPRDGQSLKTVYQALFNKGGIEKALETVSNSPSNQLELKMPKFIQESETDTKAVLSQMGITKAFEGTAEFKDMMEKPVFVSKMKQKAYIDVNEKGTEAAAVDVAVMTRSASLPVATPTMIFDKPFLGVIHDDAGRILFVNTVTDLPAAK